MAMMFTKSEVLNFPPEFYRDPYTLMQKISDTYSCGISVETAKKIIEDYHKKS